MALWTPSNLGSGILTAWYKADSISGSDGDGVSAWTDSSGNGNNLSQAVGARQPTLQTNELNDLSVVRYDGVNDIISDGDISDLDVGTGDIWMACVFKSTDDSSAQFFLEKGASSFGLMTTAAGELQARLGGTSNIPLQSAGNWSRTEFVIVTAARVSSTCNGFVDGSAMTTTNTTNTGSISNSSVLDIGASGVGSQPMTGDIAEILVGGATLTSSDREKLEGYLAWKWGLQDNLPSAHPYKIFPPTFTLPTVYWTAGGNPADVSDPDNWSDNLVPDASKKCVFNDTASVITTGTLTAGEVRFSNGFSGDLGTPAAPIDITTDLLSIDAPDASVNVDSQSIADIYIGGNGRGVHVEGTATNVNVESKDPVTLSLTSIQRLDVRHDSGAGGVIATQSATNTVIGYGGNVEGNDDLSGVKVYEGGYLFQHAGSDINGLQIFGGAVLFHGTDITRTTNKIWGGLLTIRGTTRYQVDLDDFAIYNGGTLDLSDSPIADFTGDLTIFGGKVILGDGYSVAVS
jgi:hypothetical protein